MSLVLQSSGGGQITIQEPTTASNFTVTLPASTGTVLTTTSPKVGNVLQVVSTTKTDTFSTTSSTFVDVTGLSISITPSATTSKILVFYTVNIGHNADTGHSYIRLVRNSTDIAIADTAGSRTSATSVVNSTASGEQNSYAMIHLDSPNTTSSVTYKLTARTTSANGVFFGRSQRDSDLAAYDGRSVCSITVMEIAG